MILMTMAPKSVTSPIAMLVADRLAGSLPWQRCSC